MRPSMCKWESTKVAGDESDNLIQDMLLKVFLGSTTFKHNSTITLNHRAWTLIK